MNQTTHTEAESFQLFLSHQIANGGRNKSPEELVELWRRDQQELHESVASIREAIENMHNGARGQSVAEVACEMRQHFGWSRPVRPTIQ